MTYAQILTGLTAVATCVLPLSADQSTVCTDKFWVVAGTLDDVPLPVGYAASHELDESSDANDRVTRLVVVIHPTGNGYIDGADLAKLLGIWQP